MNNPNFIRLSGWLMILGSIAFLPGAIGMLSWEGQSTGSTSLTMQLAGFAVFLAPLLMVLGMLGLRARYKIGGSFLLFGVIVGGLMVIVGILVQFLTPDYSVSETYYGVWLGGVVILNVCLLLFGFVALFEKPLPRWNWLPLAAGSWIVLLPILAGITGFQSSLVIIAVLVVMTILQVMLGYMLQADSPQEFATA